MRLRQLIPEDLTNDPKVHKNIGINSLKNVAINSHRGSARFIISKDEKGNHSITAGDAGTFLHQDLIPHDYFDKDEDRHLPVGGYISHHEGKFHYSAYNQGDNGSFHRIDDHPVLNKMRDDHNVEKGIWSPRARRVKPFHGNDNPNSFEAKESILITGIRKLLSENIVMTAHALNNTKTLFTANATDNDGINKHIHHLHKWVQSTGTPLHVLAQRPDGTTHSGNIHPHLNPPYIE